MRGIEDKEGVTEKNLQVCLITCEAFPPEVECWGLNLSAWAM